MSLSSAAEETQTSKQPLLSEELEGEEEKRNQAKTSQTISSSTKSEEKRFLGSLIMMVAHVLAISLPIVIGVTALINFSFFSWHPVCMTIAYAFLMTEAILIFSPESSLAGQASRATKVNYHGYMLFCALLSASGGFTVIYMNKNAFGKSHFTSWHGLLGVITVGYTIVQVCAGIFLKYGAAKVKLPQGLTLAKMKVYHSLSGCCLFLLGCGTLLLGMNSSWFTTKVHEYVWGGAMIAGILLMGVGLSHLSHIIKTRCAPQRKK